MNHETVATEPWVYNQLAKVWNAINATNNELGGLAGANGLGGLADNVETKCVTGVVIAETIAASGMHGIAVDFFTGYNGVTRHETKPTIFVAAVDHSHNISMSGTDLVLAPGVNVG
jgi:hypothetical protein